MVLLSLRSDPNKKRYFYVWNECFLMNEKLIEELKLLEFHM